MRKTNLILIAGAEKLHGSERVISVNKNLLRFPFYHVRFIYIRSRECAGGFAVYIYVVYDKAAVVKRHRMGRPCLIPGSTLPWSQRPAAMLKALGREEWIAVDTPH